MLVMADSVSSLSARYGTLITAFEWFFPGLYVLVDVRVLLLLLRVFRIFKLAAYVSKYQSLAGTLMYVVEGPGNGFTNPPGR
jgi:voltage-gated potassium channel